MANKVDCVGNSWYFSGTLVFSFILHGLGYDIFGLTSPQSSANDHYLIAFFGSLALCLRLGVTFSETKPNKSQIKRNKTAAGQVLQKKAFTLVKVEVEHFSKLLTAGEVALQNGGF